LRGEGTARSRGGGQAAIDLDRCTGDVAGPWGRQESDDLGHLFGRPEPAQRRALRYAFAERGNRLGREAELADGGRVDGPRTDRIDYAAFGSKERLFFEAIDLFVENVGHRPMQALETRPTGRESVEAMLRESVDIFCGKDTPLGCLVFLGAINCTPASKSVQDHMRGYRTQVADLIRKRLERAVAEGDVPKGIDLEPIVSFYATFVHGLPIRARDGASRKDLLAGVTGAMAAWIG
jgi:AcrR family transcriptional regulator